MNKISSSASFSTSHSAIPRRVQYFFSEGGREFAAEVHSFLRGRLCLNLNVGPERRIARWEHEHVLETVQQRLDKNPQAMRVRRETAEHPFGTLKMRMGATHF